MEDTIKDTIKAKEENKTEAISLTLSKKNLKALDEEVERLGITSKSFLVNMILEDYFRKPIPKEEET